MAYIKLNSIKTHLLYIVILTLNVIAIIADTVYGQDVSPNNASDNVHLDIPSPFGINEDRYQRLYKILIRAGLSKERVREIFTSNRAKAKDMTAVKIMSKPKTSFGLDKKEVLANKNAIKNIPLIIKHLNANKKYYDLAQSKYNVNREIIAAILYKETNLGSFKNWEHEAFTALNSMYAFLEETPISKNDRAQRRAKRLIEFARDNLAALLIYCDKHDLDILTRRFPSSYAAAVGIPQFTPHVLDYSVSYNNTLPNLNTMPDAILSVANLLRNGYNWSESINYDKIDNIDELINKWNAYSEQENVSFASAVHLDGHRLRRFDEEYSHLTNIEYLSRYVRTIMKYNFSSNYSLGVLQIAYHTNKRL
ncbi:membrane-bound lytic murein transglycosylase B [Candidatus Magnetoovum chiemensis]|nr:membrane-bound lytic murein transglycosylase B [Candidatus Magnetoovum chiemensis]